jgi:hypothetical protein
MRFLALVGEYARELRIALDFVCNPRRNPRVIIVRDAAALERLRQLEGDEVGWYDMGADREQRAFCREHGYTQLTFDEARDFLREQRPV